MRNRKGRPRLTEISNLTSLLRSPKIASSISGRGAVTSCKTLAVARTACGSAECRCKYWELKVSSETSSGRSLETASTKTGPIGAGGVCGNEVTGVISYVKLDI